MDKKTDAERILYLENLVAERDRYREALSWISLDGLKGRHLLPNQKGFRQELIDKAKEALEKK